MASTPVTITHLDADPLAGRPTEFVERKGVGHPDTICDGIAEAVSRRLSEAYRERFGRVLHHNTDKVQLVAGRAAPAFGGGTVDTPITVFVGGRATTSVGDERIPANDLAVAAAREYVTETVPAADPDVFTFESHLGETSTDLQALFEDDGVPHANDTSVGVGYAPLSETDHVVRSVESVVRDVGPAVGADVKVMGHRHEAELHLTVAAAIVGRHVVDLDEYVDVTARIRDAAERHARAHTDREVSVAVNAADDVDAGSVYLTVTGLSAEMGDDGNVGRGNRANGLITPHRPMSLEAVAGKNPVSHVGKLYNVLATDVAERLTDELDAEYAGVKLLSEIGRPITDPVAVDVDTTATDDDAVSEVVRDELDSVTTLTERVLAGERRLF